MRGLKLFLLLLLVVVTSVGHVRSEDECDPPSGLDSVPVVSQFKSLFQWIGGDSKGARCTQENFSKGAPVVSQIRSAVEAGQGDAEAARKTQEFFLDNVIQTAESTPGLGHIIGAVEVAVGETERGKETLKGASRSTAVIVGGLTGGPAGAVAGGVVFDGIASGIEGKGSGVFETIENIDEVSKDPGKSFDAFVGTALDAFGAPKRGKNKNKGSQDGDASKDKDNNGDQNGSNQNSRNPDEGTRIGSSNPDAMDLDTPPRSPNSDAMDIDTPPRSPNLNDINNNNLRRRESWENMYINDLRLTDNCYYCTLSALSRSTVSDMINQLEILQIRGGAELPHILELFHQAGFKDARSREFQNSNQLHNFLNNIIDKGTKQEFGLAYKTDPDNGHMVVLKAWKDSNGVLDYRAIDFQQDPNSNRRFIPSELPTGTTWLFYRDPQAMTQLDNAGLRITGTNPPPKDLRNHFLSLEQLALSGAVQHPGRNSSFVFTKGFNSNPNKEFLQNGRKKIPIEENVAFTAGCAAPGYLCGKKIVGYYTGWGTRYFTVYHAQRLTHVIFAFMKMNSDWTVSDDLGKDQLDRLERLLRVAKYFDHLRVMFAIGGWENSQYFSAMASSESGRQKFISSVMDIVNKWGFRGVDVDWEYPVTGGAQEGVSGDKENYVKLMSELRAALDRKGTGYQLSFASAAGQWTLNPGFDLPGLLKYADWVNVMTYDYFGAWESQWGAFTGPPAPLYFGAPKKWSGKLNVDWTMRYYACRIKDPNKIVMGVPFYGRYWYNVGPPYNESDGMWRLALATHGRTEGGAAMFYEMRENYLKDSSFQRTFQNVAKTPYLWNSAKSMYVGYEDEESLKYKVEYAVAKNLGGIMIWAVDLDDDDLSLLNVVYKAPMCTGSNSVNFKCSPITDKRWWTWDDNKENAGMCGKSSPLYNGFYPVCDPEDDGFSCCGAFGYCGSGSESCDCPTCVDYGNHPEKVLQGPVKPTGPILWYLNNDEDGKRGRCGRDIPKINGEYPICNPDDPNAHCCSNGFYCGAGPASCECDGCIDFKKNPGYRFKEKTWFDWSDGPEKSGKCGKDAPTINGKMSGCNPDSKWPCCSEWGTCGDSDEHCKCEKCVDYRKH